MFHTLSDHCVGEKCLMTKYAFMGNFFGEFHNQWLSSVVLINMKQSHFRQFFLLCLLLLRAVLVLFLSSVQPSQKDLGSGPNGSGSSAPERRTIFTMSKASLGTGDATKTDESSEKLQKRVGGYFQSKHLFCKFWTFK